MTTGGGFSSDEMAAWRVNLMTWQIIERGLDRQLQRDSSMPHAYYGILVELNEQQDRSLPITRIASRLDYSQSRMSHAVDRLEEAGWVERLPDAADRRVTSIRLTGQGRLAYARASVGHVAEVRRVFFDALDDRDLADLRRIGAKLFDGLRDGRGVPDGQH